MANDLSAKSERWLAQEDELCRQDRLTRLNWLAARTPKTDYLTFPGGLMSKYLFEEARYCFVYGQFLATIVVGLSYIEQTLASLFYAFGRNDLERASISTLLRESLKHGLIDQIDYENLEQVRRIRNPVTHFRKPGHGDTIAYRMVAQNEMPYTIIEEDARHVMEAVLRLVDRNAI